MQPSERLVSAVKVAEGFRASAYFDRTGKVWTVGFGETLGVTERTRITEDEADKRLRTRLSAFGSGVQRLVRVPLTQSQFDALTDFAYNGGLAALAQSALLMRLNNRDMQGAAFEFSRWNKSGGEVLAGLTKRRAMEHSWFAETISSTERLA
jgi:lysozyme